MVGGVIGLGEPLFIANLTQMVEEADGTGSMGLSGTSDLLSHLKVGLCYSVIPTHVGRYLGKSNSFAKTL